MLAFLEGEPVEFDVAERDGKKFAQNVTGPDGAPVEGAAPRPGKNNTLIGSLC
jgi:hypothetical protein